MNEIWCVTFFHIPEPLGWLPWVAQAAPVGDAITQSTAAATNWLQGLAVFLPRLIAAIAVLILGWLIALVVASVVRGILSKTNLDDRIARSISGHPTSEAESIRVERWISAAVFWLIMLFAIVAFLNALQLPAVSTPLTNLLNQIFAYLPRLGGAVVLLLVAWLLATIAKLVVTRGLSRFNLDDRLAAQTGGTTDSPFLLNETLGNALYWFVLLFFLPLILDVLNLQGPLQPVQNLLDQILSALPRILTAVLIAAVGWLIARVVRGIVTNLLTAVGTNQIGTRIGLTQAAGGLSLSALLGTIVYVLILIPTAIAALNALQIAAISAPAIRMLEQILTALPLIFTAGLILAIFYVIGRFVADLVASILTSVGFNNIFRTLGFPASVTTTRTPPPPSPPTVTGTVPGTAPGTTTPPIPVKPAAGAKTVVQSGVRSPSEIAGIVVLVGIMLLGAVAATEVLGFESLTAVVYGILAISARVLIGLLVFGVGLYLANLA